MSAICQTDASKALAGEPDRQSAAYRAALEFLYARINYEQLPREQYSEAGFKLDRMQALLQRIGDPQLAFPAIHIAGTKGKGSTAVICAALLEAAGKRVGLFTSPHLTRFEERMRVNGIEPSPREVVSLVDDVSTAAESLAAEGPDRRPTFFEITTAMAWKYFQHAGAEIVVLEVGLGGRLDATNICRPAATIITSISKDHTQLLGNTLAEIAREKAGIIKPGVPVFCGVTDDPAAGVIADVALQSGAPLFMLGREISCSEMQTENASALLPYWRANIRTPWRVHSTVRVPLAGEHQVANTALALAAFDFVLRDTAPVHDDLLSHGLGTVRWPLRIEALNSRPLVIVDAAHNSASMAALIATLQRVTAQQKLAVFSASRDKDIPEMLRIAAGFFDRIMLTQYTSNPRAASVADLAVIASVAGVRRFETIESPVAAWQAARQLAAPDDLLCITGSFFLGAELREVILNDSSRPRPSDPLFL